MSRQQREEEKPECLYTLELQDPDAVFGGHRFVCFESEERWDRTMRRLWTWRPHVMLRPKSAAVRRDDHAQRRQYEFACSMLKPANDDASERLCRRLHLSAMRAFSTRGYVLFPYAVAQWWSVYFSSLRDVRQCLRKALADSQITSEAERARIGGKVLGMIRCMDSYEFRASNEKIVFCRATEARANAAMAALVRSFAEHKDQ